MSDPGALWRDPHPLVLASGSATRKTLLASAGLSCITRPAAIDERAAEVQARKEGADPAQLALHLAQAKARDVSVALADHHPQAIVIGADQTLALGETILHKPADMQALHEQIAQLSGRSHRLHAGVSLWRGGTPLVSFVDSATLTMRALKPEQIARYCALAGEDALTSVGGYRLEGAGIHLFTRVEGAHSTILGLPLMPLLAALRDQGCLAL